MQNAMKKSMQQTVTVNKTSLIKYTLLSVVFAISLLLTVILPAEYNIDPTGIGAKLGLTVFSTTEMNREMNREVNTALNGETTETLAGNNKEQTIKTSVLVPAGRGVEYKFTMLKFKKLTYEWKTTGAPLYFDLHGEPKGDTTGYFESYAIATVSEMKGSFTTPFSGVHGWYWKNTSDVDVMVQLTVNGEYSEHGLK